MVMTAVASRRLRLLSSRVPVLAIAVLGALCGPLAAQGTTPRTLAAIPVEGRLADIPFPVYAHLTAADGSDYALVFVEASQLSKMRGARALARADSPREFILGVARRPEARRVASALGEVVLDDGRHVVARASEAQALAFVRAGLDIERLREEPLAIVPRTATALASAAALAYDPAVAAMVGAVTQTEVSDLTAQLSGVQPITADGAAYTLTTRSTLSGTPITKATQFAYERFAALGLTTTFQSWTDSTSGTSGRNVIGELRGTTKPSEIVVIGAHLDDMPETGTAPGADDNATGSAAVLLAAKILSTHRFQRTIRFVLFTGEEQGIYGSAAYAKLLADQGANVVGAVSLDMLAWSSHGTLKIRLHARAVSNPGSTQDQAIATVFKDAIAAYLPGALVPITTTDGEPASDHSSFWAKGWPAILAIEDDYDDYNPNNHTAADTLATLNLGYYTNFVRASVGATAHLALPAAASTACVPGATTLCIDDVAGDGRFKVEVDWATAQGGGQSGQGKAVSTTSLGISRGGIFWFFAADNPEMLVKILNGCSVTGKYWVFYSAGTNVGLTTRMTDTVTGLQKTYLNPDLNLVAPVADTAAFSCTPARSAAPRAVAVAADPPKVSLPEPAAARNVSLLAACSPTDTTLCIDDTPGDKRFKVEVDWATAQGGGQSGQGHAISTASLGISRGGIFWFFGADNPEMLVKVLNGCSNGGRYWVFYSAGTNVGLNVRVTDTTTGTQKTYTNPDLALAAPKADTDALPCN